VPYLLSLILLLSFNVWGAELQIPALSSPVMDEAGFLSADEKKDLADLAYEIFAHQGPQITIFTVPDLQEHAIEDFSIRVGEKWKLGTKEKGNGLLIIVSKAERKVRIEVGQGIEGEITDYEANAYIRNILTPYFAKGQFHDGLRLVMQDIAQKFNIDLSNNDSKIVRRSARPQMTMAFPLALPLILVALIITQIMFQNNTPVRSVFGGLGVAGAGFAALGFAGIGMIAILFFVGVFGGLIGFHNILFALAQGGGRGGGGGFGGGGGGGWSGGGGGFSGGGSSGSW
jgi:uncharacterized protein